MHPPQGSNLIYVFQADGNLGLTAALAEAVLQSQAGEIQLLPALPDAWSTGSFTGMRARGGFELSLAWDAGRLSGGSLESTHGQHCTLVSATPFIVNDASGRTVARSVTNDRQHEARFDTIAAGIYHIEAM
jgi:alpha-L-fucosidase 2